MQNIFSDKSAFQQVIRPGVIVGVDLGLKKVGLAILPATVLIPMPYKVVAVADCIVEIATLKPQGIIIGVSKGEVANKGMLKKIVALDIPIFLQDETYSSLIANQKLQEAGVKRRKRHAIDDKIAAQLILEWYLDG